MCGRGVPSPLSFTSSRQKSWLATFGLVLHCPTPMKSLISQNADDNTMTVTTDDAIKAILDIYSLYEKSKGLWLGAWAHRSDPPFPLDWSSERIPCLGTFLGPNLAPSVNWDPRIQSLSNVLDLWQRRCLSFQVPGCQCSGPLGTVVCCHCINPSRNS